MDCLNYEQGGSRSVDETLPPRRSSNTGSNKSVLACLLVGWPCFLLFIGGRSGVPACQASKQHILKSTDDK